MNKPGCHRTGLDAHFGVDTSMLRNASRNWPGIGGADAAPEPPALLVDNADRGRLLRYVQPNIMRHRNLRWCKPPGNMPRSRHYRCLRLRPAITRGPYIRGRFGRPQYPSEGPQWYGQPTSSEHSAAAAKRRFRTRKGRVSPTVASADVSDS